MKNSSLRSASALLILFLLLAGGCKDSKTDWYSIPDTLKADGSAGYSLLDLKKYNYPDSIVNVEVTGAPRDLYLGVYNTGSGDTRTPAVTVQGLGASAPAGSSTGIFLNDRISQSNLQLSSRVADLSPARSIAPPARSAALIEPLEKEVTFLDELSSGKKVSRKSILKYVKTEETAQGPRTLKIWVEDKSLDGRDATITQKMVDALANEFLTDGLGNDIYDYVTAIFGPEWGDHSYSAELIPMSNEINILLADLESDGATDEGVAGFFWAKDNLLRNESAGDSSSISNERIMFYIDSIFYSQKDKGSASWEADCEWAKEMYSTLAHEFQHMINFYQTAVVKKLKCETWLNELLSMATEDLLSYTIGIPGPKGFMTNDGKAPASGSKIEIGRLPLFNIYPSTPHFTWLPHKADSNGMSYQLRSYSLMYTYGAYLLRNFGGPAVLRNLMYTCPADGASMAKALDISGNNPALGAAASHLHLMYAGLLLSDRTDAPAGMRFNNGGWFTWNFEGIEYRAASLNFHSYYFPPTVLTADQFRSIGDIPGQSVVMVKEKENLIGSSQIHTSLYGDSTDSLWFMLR